jgi:spore maturation protein CgeB
MKIVILGLSITSSWGNGHATTYRGLVRELVRRGHAVVFLERDQPWYAQNRDLPHPPYGETHLYNSLGELHSRFGRHIREADLVIVGSFVPEGAEVGDWVMNEADGLTAFYDIDTPVTLAKLAAGDCPYLSPELILHYHLYLSFTGGPTLERIETVYGAPLARPLYCAVDPELYYPELSTAKRWKLGYLGTYSEDRQPALERLLVMPARLEPSIGMVVAGSLYPETVQWPQNVERIAHLSPADHRAFYNAQDFTLNITRTEMIRAGYSPSVRLFEAAACGTPIISDSWPGLEEFFIPGEEILLAESPAESLAILRELPSAEAIALGQRARERVLASHTAAHRAEELEALITSPEILGVPLGRSLETSNTL